MSVHPYSEPDFISHFSVVARWAIELDWNKNQPITEVGGVPPLRPCSPNTPLFILPSKTNVIIGSNPPIQSFGNVVPPLLKTTQNMGNQGQLFGFPSFNPPGPSRSENVLTPIRLFAQFQPKEKCIFRHERSISSSPIPELPTQGTSTRQRALLSEKSDRGSNRTEKILHRQSKHCHVSYSPASSDSSSESDENWGFKKGNFLEASTIHPTTPSAKRFSTTVKGYNKDRKGAIRSFIAAGLKPGGFPQSLLPNLFKGNYIDLEKIAEELAAAEKGWRYPQKS